eukprot:jgi/Bigna1/59750/fgenesh1_kg.6_\
MTMESLVGGVRKHSVRRSRGVQVWGNQMDSLGKQIEIEKLRDEKNKLLQLLADRVFAKAEFEKKGS